LYFRITLFKGFFFNFIYRIQKYILNLFFEFLDFSLQNNFRNLKKKYRLHIIIYKLKKKLIYKKKLVLSEKIILTTGTIKKKPLAWVKSTQVGHKYKCQILCSQGRSLTH